VFTIYVSISAKISFLQLQGYGIIFLTIEHMSERELADEMASQASQESWGYTIVAMIVHGQDSINHWMQYTQVRFVNLHKNAKQ